MACKKRKRNTNTARALKAPLKVKTGHYETEFKNTAS